MLGLPLLHVTSRSASGGTYKRLVKAGGQGQSQVLPPPMGDKEHIVLVSIPIEEVVPYSMSQPPSYGSALPQPSLPGNDVDEETDRRSGHILRQASAIITQIPRAFYGRRIKIGTLHQKYHVRPCPLLPPFHPSCPPSGVRASRGRDHVKPAGHAVAVTGPARKYKRRPSRPKPRAWESTMPEFQHPIRTSYPAVPTQFYLDLPKAQAD